MSETRMRDTRSIRELIACQKPGWSLEQRFYTDPEIYALELESIVTRNWIFAGHQSQLAQAGEHRWRYQGIRKRVPAQGIDRLSREER
jgi:hypothetical protein